MAVGGVSMYYVLLMQGLCATLWLWLTASFISCVAGIVCGTMRSRVLRMPYVSTALDGITFVLRGVPFYVQLLIVYFVIPAVIGLSFSAYSAALLSLGLCSAAYVSQIVRGGINAIPVGQWEAAQVLGYSTLDTVRYIIIPQMLKIVLPALVGECDQLLKSTSIVSAIGVLELTGAGRNIIVQEMNPLTIYTLLAVIYLSMSAVLTQLSAWVERRMHGG